MSLDLILEDDYCDNCKRGYSVGELNCTYNMMPMWNEIYPDADCLVEIEGMLGSVALPIISEAINVMVSKREKMMMFEPPNGWGSYDVFLRFLREIRNACENYPNARWRAER